MRVDASQLSTIYVITSGVERLDLSLFTPFGGDSTVFTTIVGLISLDFLWVLFAPVILPELNPR